MFHTMNRVSKQDCDFEEEASGVYLADLAAGERASMKYWRIEPGATLPAHQHPNEQIGFLISGRLTAIVEGEERELEPGDSYVFPGEELHGAENRGDDPAVGVGVLSPPRGSPRWGGDAPSTEEGPSDTPVESDD